MYIKPIGTNPPDDEDRRPIIPVINGDVILINTRLTLRDGVTGVTPVNSQVHIELANNQFDEEPIWEGTWDAGITEVDSINHIGLITAKVPQDIADSLRRGSYRFSIRVGDRFNRDEYTPVIGTIIVEYAPTSPNHDLPYDSGPDEPVDAD